MNNTYLLLFLLPLFSCSSPKENQEQKDYVENAIPKEQNVSLSDSIELEKLIEKTDLISTVLDSTVELAKNKKIHSDLLEYDCFVLCLQHRIEYDDTLCYVGPSQSQYLMLNDDPVIGYYGFWEWNQYPVFVQGNVSSYFFQKANQIKPFFTGIPVLDGDDIPWPRFRFTNNTFIRVSEMYP